MKMSDYVSEAMHLDEELSKSELLEIIAHQEENAKFWKKLAKKAKDQESKDFYEHHAAISIGMVLEAKKQLTELND